MAPATAQVAPNAGEIAAYRGLLAAAAKGDAALAEKLIAGGADVNEREGYRRTPLHVATFAKQRDIIARLAKARADLGAQEREPGRGNLPGNMKTSSNTTEKHDSSP